MRMLIAREFRPGLPLPETGGPNAHVQDSTRFSFEFQRMRRPDLSDRFASWLTSAAWNPSRIGAVGVLRLRAHSRKF